MIWPLNGFLRSKPLAIDWAKRCMGRFHRIDEEMFQLLTPLVENDNEVLGRIVSTYLGRKGKGFTISQMQAMIKQPDFPEKCLLRNKQINELDTQLKRLRVKELKVFSLGKEYWNGSYNHHTSKKFHKEYSSVFEASHSGGAMSSYWQQEKMPYDTEANTDKMIIVEAADVYGSRWEIYSVSIASNGSESDQQQLEYENRQLLAEWENGFSTSLVPPNYGWVVVGGDPENKIRIRYSFEDPKPYSY